MCLSLMRLMAFGYSLSLCIALTHQFFLSCSVLFEGDKTTTAQIFTYIIVHTMHTRVLPDMHFAFDYLTEYMYSLDMGREAQCGEWILQLWRQKPFIL